MSFSVSSCITVVLWIVFQCFFLSFPFLSFLFFTYVSKLLVSLLFEVVLFSFWRCVGTISRDDTAWWLAGWFTDHKLWRIAWMTGAGPTTNLFWKVSTRSLKICRKLSNVGATHILKSFMICFRFLYIYITYSTIHHGIDDRRSHWHRTQWVKYSESSKYLS